MAAVGKIIYELLTCGSPAATGLRVWPIEADQDADMPYIVYDVVSAFPTNTKDGGSAIDTYRVQVTVWGSRQDMVTIYEEAAAIREALDQQRGTLNELTYDKIIYDGGDSETYSLDGDLMGLNIDFLIRIKN
jgi:hypothetical protein